MSDDDGIKVIYDGSGSMAERSIRSTGHEMSEPNAEYAPPCDVVEGCPNPSVDCVGGEVWYCADHEDGAYDAYVEWQKSPERAARSHDAMQHDDCKECGTWWGGEDEQNDSSGAVG